MTNTEQLIEVMTKKGLKAKDVAEILGVKVNTVRIWRTLRGKVIPDNKLELLKYKLKIKR